MNITIFGILWVLAIIVCFSKNIKYMYALTLLSMIFQCDLVVVLGTDIGIGPAIITSVAFIIKSVLPLNRCVIKIERLKVVLLLFLFFISVSTFFINEDSNKIMAFVQLYVYVLCFFRMNSMQNKIRSENLEKYMKLIVIVVFFIGVIQLLYASGLSFLHEPLRVLIYNENGDEAIVFNKSYNVLRFYSSFMEPSYCSVFLVGSLFYFLSISKNIKNRVIIITILVVSIILTMSATAFGAVLVVGLVFLCLGSNKKLIKNIMPILVMVLLIGLIFYADTIENLVAEKLASGSGMTRANWNKWAWEDFLLSPLWGVGYKNSRGSSLAITLMAEFGIIGTFFFLCALFIIVWPILKKENNFDISGSYFVVSAIVAMIIACPDISLSPFWLSMYVFAVTSRKKKND